jgi:hypothetical protein
MSYYIIVHTNPYTGEYFFSTSHLQGVEGVGKNYPEGFVAVTHYIPCSVVPRPELPSGMVTNVREMVTIFYDDGKEIPNPDPSFQPATSCCRDPQVRGGMCVNCGEWIHDNEPHVGGTTPQGDNEG